MYHSDQIIRLSNTSNANNASEFRCPQLSPTCWGNSYLTASTVFLNCIRSFRNDLFISRRLMQIYFTCLNCDSGRKVVDLEFKNPGKRIYVCIYQNPCLCVSFFAESSPVICFLAQGFICLETLAGSVKLPFLKAVSGFIYIRQNKV